MLVFIDGQDRCGKDTLIEKLRTQITNPKLTVQHEAKPPKGVDAEEWSRAHYQYMLSTAYQRYIYNESAIYNRTHLGETIWGPKYRGYNADFIFDLERNYLRSCQECFLILLTDSAERLMARDDGKSFYSSAGDLDWERNAFQSAFDHSCITNKLHIKLDEVAFENVFSTAWSFIDANRK